MKPLAVSLHEILLIIIILNNSLRSECENVFLTHEIISYNSMCILVYKCVRLTINYNKNCIVCHIAIATMDRRKIWKKLIKNATILLL